MNDITQTLLRSVLKVLGGYFVAKGYLDENTLEEGSAAAIVIVGIAWGVWHRSAGQSQSVPIKPGTVTLPSALLLLALGSGCVVNKQYATTTSTNPTNGVVSVTVARASTVAIGDAKAVVDKTHASAGKTSAVGASGISEEAKASETISAGGQLLGEALKTLLMSPTPPKTKTPE